MHYFPNKAFTLAELLIALAILGVIATFTIPKVLTNQADQQKKAVFKEDIAAISAIVQEAILNGTICQNARAEYDSKLNYIKRCTTDTIAQGCWVGTPSNSTDPNGYLLVNGSSIVDLDVIICSNDSDGVSIDWNGPLPPNVEGDDQLLVTVYYQKVFGPTSRPGSIIPQAGSAVLWSQIFQN